MMLDALGLPEYRTDEERVAILVGPNGSGKSNHLRSIATTYRDRRDVTIVCNTAYDRFAGLRDIRRLSAGRGGKTPKSVIKEAVTKALGKGGSEFFQISSTLEYCGYHPRFGFLAERTQKMRWLPPFVDKEEAEKLDITDQQKRDIEDALRFLDRTRSREIIWIDAGESSFHFSRLREFETVLRCEALLRKLGRITTIQVFLKKQSGHEIELHNASSGELSLISSLLFLVSHAPDGGIILIDEPENSLHPNWQREYIDKLAVALSYRGAAIVVATHAPLIVTGALALLPDRVTVRQLRHGTPQRLPIDDKTAQPSGIEEILWKAFEVVTPANHFVSEEIVQAIGDYEKDVLGKDALLALVARMESESFDKQQQAFFVAIRDLIGKVEARKADDKDGAIADD